MIDQLPEHRTPALIAAGVSLLAAGAVFAGQALTSGPAELAGPSYQHNGEFVGKDRAVVNHVEPGTAPGGADVPAVLGNGTFVLAAPLNEDGRVVIRDAGGAILETIRPTRWRMWQ